MPAARITEVLHDVARATGFAAAFTNLRTGERCEDESALLAAVLADATNLGLDRMAAASHGVTRDRLVWTADAYIRPETYRAALARIIDAHNGLPVAAAWGDGTTSSSDRQFFRSARRGNAAGEVNARYGPDPGLGFYTHVSDQHGPYNARVMSATGHEAPYVLDGLLHHGTALRILGPRRGHRRTPPAAQPGPQQDRRMTDVPDLFTLRVVHLTTDARPSMLAHQAAAPPGRGADPGMAQPDPDLAVASPRRREPRI